MANRSYIYGLKNGKHFSVGEYPYKIPYAFRILAAYDNKTGESDLFDKDVAIRADFKRGRQALYKLLDFLIATGRMKNQEAFAEQVQSTKAFLDAIDADQTLLENGEIYALYTKDGEYLDGPGLEKANHTPARTISGWERTSIIWRSSILRLRLFLSCKTRMPGKCMPG